MRLAPDGSAGTGGGPTLRRRPRRKSAAPREVERERQAWTATSAVAPHLEPDQDPALSAWLLSDVAWAVRGLGSDMAGDDQATSDSASRIVRRALDVIERLLSGRAYLSGCAFGVLDLTAAAVLAPIARPEGWRWARSRSPRRSDSLWPTTFYGHPAAAWVRRVYDLHAGTGGPPPATLAWAP